MRLILSMFATCQTKCLRRGYEPVGKAHYYDLDARAPIVAGPLFIHQVGRRRILGGARRDRATAAQELKLADSGDRTGALCPNC